MLCLKEWNLDSFMFRTLWNPLKVVGKKLQFLSMKTLFFIFIPAYLVGLILYFTNQMVPTTLHDYVPVTLAFIGLLMVLRSFVERRSPMLSWILIMMNHFWLALAISFNENFLLEQTLLYLSGIVVAGAVGIICLQRLYRNEEEVNLNQFHGYSAKYPVLTFVFLLAALGLVGFPVTPTFIGEDLVVSHIHEDQFFLALFTALSLIIDGLAAIRIFARLFLGPVNVLYSRSS
jgi:hypothetical protein